MQTCLYGASDCALGVLKHGVGLTAALCSRARSTDVVLGFELAHIAAEDPLLDGPHGCGT